MARIEITLPEKFNFSTTLTVRIGDINSGNHLSHASVVLLLQEARAQFLLNRGYSEQYDVKSGIGFIIADLGVVYKKQGNYGRLLQVDVAVIDFKDKSFDIVYRITEQKSGLELVRAKTGIVAFDYHKQTVIPVPDGVKEKLTT